MTTFEVTKDHWPEALRGTRGRPPNPLWDALAKQLTGAETLRVVPEEGKDIRAFSATVRKMLAQRGMKVNVRVHDDAVYVRLANPPGA